MDKLLDKIKNDLKLIEKWKATQRANLVYDRSSRYFVELSSENYNDFISTIKEIASYIKDTDGFTANNLLQIADYVCSKLINQGQWSGIYAVNDYFLGALQFTVDYLDSEGYKSLYKNKSSKLFISHSEKDKLYIEKFVEMLNKLGIRKQNLFCSSLVEYGIPLNQNIYEYLRNEFKDKNLFVILVLSSNYYKSPACLNEMGAAWSLQTEYQSILLPGFKYEEIKGAIDPYKISIGLDDISTRDYRLTELKNRIVQIFDLIDVDSSEWERHKKIFLTEVDNINVV